MSEDQVPDWWDEVIEVDLSSKASAREVIRRCREGEKEETWKPQFSTYRTPQGRIKVSDFERAQDILMGVADRDPGRKGFHDWETIDRLIDKAAEDMGPRVIRAEVCRRVSEWHPTISPTSSTLRKRVSDRMKATGR